MRKIANMLGIELVDIPEFSCCGAGSLEEKDKLLNLIVNARNFGYAKKQGLDIMTTCNTCLNTMLRAKYDLNDENDYKVVESSLKEQKIEFDRNIKITHLLWVLINKVGEEKIKRLVKYPLENLNVACFYGCHIIRPDYLMDENNRIKTDYLERIARALGANPVEYKRKLKCCGFHTLMTSQKSSLSMNAENIKDALSSKANVIVTPCPLCHVSMDMYQEKSKKYIKFDNEIPILHLSQLLGLAFGFKPEELGLERHITGCKKILSLKL